MISIRNLATVWKLALVASLFLPSLGCTGGDEELPVLDMEEDKDTVSKSIDDPFGTAPVAPE